MEIVDDGVRYMVAERPRHVEVGLPLTREEFKELYAVWRCGGSFIALARAHGVNPYELGWAFVMKNSDSLDGYKVHYKASN